MEGQTLTVRERLERHRADPGCAPCHAIMDPMGFGLENFDAIGRFRTSEEGEPLDTTGTLPDGTSFANAEQLGAIVAVDPRFRSCMAQKLATYALGRGIDELSSAALIQALVSQVAESDGSMVALTAAVVKSPPFRMRSPEPKAGM